MNFGRKYVAVGIVYLLVLFGSIVVKSMYVSHHAEISKMETGGSEFFEKISFFVEDSDVTIVKNTTINGWRMTASYWESKPTINKSSNLEIYASSCFIVFEANNISDLYFEGISSSLNLIILNASAKIDIRLRGGRAKISLMAGEYNLTISVRGELDLVANNAVLRGTMYIENGDSTINIATSSGGVFSYKFYYCEYLVVSSGFEKTERKYSDRIEGILYSPSGKNNLDITAKYCNIDLIVTRG